MLWSGVDSVGQVSWQRTYSKNESTWCHCEWVLQRLLSKWTNPTDYKDFLTDGDIMRQWTDLLSDQQKIIWISACFRPRGSCSPMTPHASIHDQELSDGAELQVELNLQSESLNHHRRRRRDWMVMRKVKASSSSLHTRLVFPVFPPQSSFKTSCDILSSLFFKFFPLRFICAQFINISRRRRSGSRQDYDLINQK